MVRAFACLMIRATACREDGGSTPPLLFRSLGNFVYPTLPVSFRRDTKSHWSLLSGVYLVSTWCLSGVYLVSGVCLVSTWCLSGVCLVSVWVSVWCLPGVCLVSVWCLSGVYARESKRSQAGIWKKPVMDSLTLDKDTLK